MITPDEPWMCGNLTSMPYSREREREGGVGGGIQAGRKAGIPGHTGGAAWVSCSENAVCTLCVAVHSATDLSAVALLMRYIVMSAQAEEQSKMTVSSVAHDHLGSTGL